MALNNENNVPDYGATGSDFPRTRSDSTLTLYHQCCDNISSNIFSINNNVAALETACKEIGTPDDCDLLRDKIHRVKQHTNEITTTTMRFVKELKRLAQTLGKEQRLQTERLENEFRITVQRYDMMQKQLVPKMKQAMLPPKKSNNVWEVDEDEEKQSLIDAEKLQQQRQIQEELEFDRGLLVEREERIKQIETDILDVNQIFLDLATMVNVQGEMVGGIEENISNTAHQVEVGAQQLSKASQYQNKYRRKLCWLVLLLLIVAGVIMIIIFANR